MAAKAPDRIASGDFSFIPGISGNKSTTDRNGYSGSITDPETDKTYSGSGATSGNSLRMKGCVLAVLCKSQTWSRL